MIVEPLRVAVDLTLTTVCLALAWMIVFLWEIGPVVAVLDAGAGRGLHSGDALAIPLLYLGWLLHPEL